MGRRHLLCRRCGGGISVRDVLEPGDDYAIGQDGDRGIDLRPVPAVVADRNRDISDAPALRPQPLRFHRSNAQQQRSRGAPVGICRDAVDRPDLVWLIVQLAIRIVDEFREPGVGRRVLCAEQLASDVQRRADGRDQDHGLAERRRRRPDSICRAALAVCDWRHGPRNSDSGPAHRPWLDGRLDRRRDADADAVDADRPGVSLGTQSGDRRKLRCRQRGFDCNHNGQVAR